MSERRLTSSLEQRYASLAAQPGLCQPLLLLRRIEALGQLARRQLACAQELGAVQEQAMVFSCYGLISHVIALECWRLYEADCVRQQHILIDNLTGLLAPTAGREVYAAAIEGNLLARPEHQQLARRIYQLTSALLHSYPHLAVGRENLCFPYRDLNGAWHNLAPWRGADLLASVEQWLAEIS